MKNLPAMREPGSIPGSGRSPGREQQPTPVFLTGEFHGYSPWNHKVSDTTKQLNNDKLKAIQGTMAGYEAG